MASLLIWGKFLNRGWIYSLELLLGFVTTTILGPESCKTHDHILLSQIRDTLDLEGQDPYSYPQEHRDPFISLDDSKMKVIL
jgi:hypothetical protein